MVWISINLKVQANTGNSTILLSKRRMSKYLMAIGSNGTVHNLLSLFLGLRLNLFLHRLLKRTPLVKIILTNNSGKEQADWEWVRLNNFREIHDITKNRRTELKNNYYRTRISSLVEHNLIERGQLKKCARIN